MEQLHEGAQLAWSWTSGSSARFALPVGDARCRLLGDDVAAAVAAAHRIAEVFAPNGMDPRPVAVATTYLGALERQCPVWASGAVRVVRARRDRVACEVSMLATDGSELARVVVVFHRMIGAAGLACRDPALPEFTRGGGGTASR